MPATNDRWVRPLNRTRSFDNAGERNKSTVERWGGLVPQCTHRSQILVGTGSTVGDRRSERVQFRFDIANANAHDQPSIRKDIDRHELLGQKHRTRHCFLCGPIQSELHRLPFYRRQQVSLQQTCEGLRNAPACTTVVVDTSQEESHAHRRSFLGRSDLSLVLDHVAVDSSHRRSRRTRDHLGSRSACS